MVWNFHNPVQVTFGEGAFTEIGAALRGRRYCLVTYGGGPFPRAERQLAQYAGRAP